MTGLVITGLTVKFGDTVAVNGLDLHVAPGEVLALVGPSGCGKSTLLRCVAGLQPADSGTLVWNGRDLSPLAPHERDVGLMFQDHALFAHRSVARNIGFGPRMHGASSAEQQQRTTELLELVGLEGFEHRNIEGLSGGEAQRVALARALAPDPSLLLLDEPLGALDRALRESLVDELRVLLRELRQTTIHVTHDQDEAFAIADRVAVMDAGVIRRIGTPEEVWADPQSRFVAAFLGHPVLLVNGTPLAIAPGAASVTLAPQGRAGVDRSPPAFAAHVIDARFQGDRWELRLRTDAGEALTAFHPERLASGTAVLVDLDLTRCHPITTA